MRPPLLRAAALRPGAAAPAILVIALVGMLLVTLACSRCALPAPGSFEAFRRSRLSLPERREPVVLVAVGDIMLSRGVTEEIRRRGDVHYPFSAMKRFLGSGDVVFGNLECPLTPGPDVGPRDMTLRADPALATALSEAGFTVLSLANNHAADFGPGGIQDTLRSLEGAGIRGVGAVPSEREARAAQYLDVKGLRLAFLAYCDAGLLRPPPGVAVLDSDAMREDIAEARASADYVVVSMHAGTEYSAEPDSAQVRYARAAVDAGADLVLGHHPHIVQRAERYRDGYIFYSLGNFVFDQLWSRATREGMAVRLHVSKAVDRAGTAGGETGSGRTGGGACVEKIEFTPVLIGAGGRPEILRGREAEIVVARLGLDVETVAVVGDVAEAASETAAAGATASVTGAHDVARACMFVAYPPGPRPSTGYRLEKRRESDLDGDGRKEHYALKDGRLTVSAGAALTWQSPAEWWVDDFVLGDSNNDGVPDLNLSIWKAGSFGPDQPFWVTQEDESVRNHLFIFDVEGPSLDPVWQSSNLDRPNCDMSIEDVDGDGRNELVTVEGDYADPEAVRVGVWRWNGWGFSTVSPHEPGVTEVGGRRTPLAPSPSFEHRAAGASASAAWSEALKPRLRATPVKRASSRGRTRSQWSR